MSNLLPWAVRTGAGFIYALLIRLGLGQLGLPDELLVDVATFVVTLLILGAAHVLEREWPKIGLVFGWIGAPKYGDVVQGQVLAVSEEAAAATKADLEQLKADVVEAVEKHVVGALTAKPIAPAEAVPAVKKAGPAKKTAAKKTTAKKA